MGQASTKHVANGLETLELVIHVCNAAEKLAATKCGKYSKEVIKQTQLLRDLHEQWSNVPKFEQLQGHQVFAVATALQTLSTKLEWCKHKLHQRHLVSVRTLSSKQQATHVLQVLTGAKDAFHNFTTAFKLAVLLSTHSPASFKGTTQQQHHQHQQGGSAAQWFVEQLELDEQHWWQQDDAEGAEASTHSQQQMSNSIAGASRSASHPTDSTAHGSLSGDSAAQQQGLQCAPAAPVSSGSHHSLHPSTPVAAAGADTNPRQQSVRVIQQSTAEPAAAVQLDAELEGLDGAPVAGSAAQHEDSLPDVIAVWERSQENWQGCMLRAWRGDVGAVLVCAQELIHGGDFCLQDCRLARQLLQTVAQQASGTACLWLGQLSERGLGLPAPDYVEAGAWFGRGAALGHLECAHALAFYYQHGLGMNQDLQAALEWYEYAADNGLVTAQNNLGQLLLQGLEGTAADAAAAMQLFQEAADQGSTTAWFNLGVCHELGLDGGKPDTAAAEACYKHAGTPQALLRLGLLYHQQHSTAASREALAAAAEAGSAEALLQLAKLQAGQLQGSRITTTGSNLQQLQQPPACVQTSFWGGCSSSGGSSLLRAAYSSDQWPGASGSIGNLSVKNSPCRPCSSLAECASADAVLQLYQRAADAGSAEAQHVYGSVCWTRGQVDEAMKAWHAAASQGYGPALLCLAEAAQKGLQGVKQDPAAARACFTMAAACGCQQAQLELSLLDREAALESSSWKSLSAALHQA